MLGRMIRLVSPLLLLPVLTMFALGAYEPETDYMQLMIEAACAGDEAAGLASQKSREEKLLETGLRYESVDFTELYLLAKIIEAEAGSSWLTEEWKMAVGEVLLNRVASPEFPDTIEECITQPGQYYGEGNEYFSSLVPSRASVEAASKLLSGERVLGDASVVFQANFPLGGGIFRELKDGALGSTYLCFTSHPELYER